MVEVVIAHFSARLNMEFNWNLSPQEAIKVQQELREKVSTKLVVANFSSRVKTVAGVDVSFPKENIARAAVVVLTYPNLKPVDQARAEVEVSFPYIPGLLAFREGPAVVAAFEKLKTDPELIIFDAQGLAHPRRLGLASHLGVLLDKPSIGCAKSKLCGEYQMPKNKVGDYTFLKDEGETIGAVVRSKLNTTPLFISIGHKINLETAVDFVLRCCQGYRLPEPTRLAHKLASGKPLTSESFPPEPQPSLFDQSI